jgi:hypothetical protein
MTKQTNIVHLHRNEQPKSSPGWPDLSFDRLGYVRGADGRTVPYDIDASRHMTKTMRDVARAFEKLSPK